MRQFQGISWRFVACVIGVSTIGCDAAGLVPVEGRVTLDGQPLANATVMLSPLRATDPGPFAGTTDAEGRFAMRSPADDRSGAAVGEYMVFITTVKSDPSGMEGAPPPAQKEVVPDDWRNGSQRYSVPEGGTIDASFDLRS
jgi:hypothetical protein